MARRTVTLYIDDVSLRLLVVKGKNIEQWVDLALEPGLVKKGVITDEVRVSVDIAHLFTSHNLNSKKVVIGISGLGCLSHLISLPQIPKSLIAEAVKQEMAAIIPVPLDQFYLSWQIISTRGGETKVFVVACPRETVDALVRTLHRAKIVPYQMDIQPLVLSRVVKEKTAIIVDVQPADFDIVIMVEGIPETIRTISFPQGAQSQQEKQFFVVQELERTISFYNSGHPESPLAVDVPLYAYGELTTEDLAGELQYSVLPLLSPLNCPPGLLLSRFLVNIGLSLKLVRGSYASVVNLNLFPLAFLPKPPSMVNMFGPPAIVVAIAALFFVGLITRNTASSNSELQRQVDSNNYLLGQRETQKQLQVKENGELEKELASLRVTSNTFTKALQMLDSGHEIVNKDLEAVTVPLTTTLSLESLSYSDSGVSLAGKSLSEDDVLTYASALRSSGRFSLVLISNISITEDGASFSLALIR